MMPHEDLIYKIELEMIKPKKHDTDVFKFRFLCTIQRKRAIKQNKY